MKEHKTNEDKTKQDKWKWGGRQNKNVVKFGKCK